MQTFTTAVLSSANPLCFHVVVGFVNPPPLCLTRVRLAGVPPPPPPRLALRSACIPALMSCWFLSAAFPLLLKSRSSFRHEAGTKQPSLPEPPRAAQRSLDLSPARFPRVPHSILLAPLSSPCFGGSFDPAAPATQNPCRLLLIRLISFWFCFSCFQR